MFGGRVLFTGDEANRSYRDCTEIIFAHFVVRFYDFIFLIELVSNQEEIRNEVRVSGIRNEVSGIGMLDVSEDAVFLIND